MSRGDRREPLFKDDADPLWFLEALGGATRQSLDKKIMRTRKNLAWGIRRA